MDAWTHENMAETGASRQTASGTRLAEREKKKRMEWGTTESADIVLFV